MDQSYSLEQLKEIINSNDGVAFYFSGNDCGVCHVLKPKVEEMIKDQFPKIKQVFISTEESKEAAAAFSVFSVPTLLVFFDKNESIRESRNISIIDLANKIQRPYGLYFQ